MSPLSNRSAWRPISRLTEPQKNGFLCPDKIMSPPKPTLDDLRIERKAQPHSRWRIWPLSAGLILLALLAVGAWRSIGPKAVQVRTVLARETAGPGSERTVLNASGYVTARRSATVA